MFVKKFVTCDLTMNEVENLVQVCPRINFLNVNHPIPHISASDSKIAANYHVYCGASAVDVVDDCNKFVRQYLSLGVERSVPYEDVIDAVTTVFSHLSIHNAEYDLNLRHLGSIVAEVERTTSKYAEMVNYRAAIIDAFMRIPGVVECSIFCDQKSLDHYLLHLAGSCELIDCKLETVTFSSACISNQSNQLKQPDQINNYKSGLFISNLDDLTVASQLPKYTRGSIAIVGLGCVSDDNICMIVVSQYVDCFGKRLDRMWFDRWRSLYEVAVKSAAALEITNAKHARLEKLYHFYNSLLGGEELAVGAKTESDLMNGMCQRIVASDAFLSAWIARPDQEGRFKLIASRGAGVKTLKVFELSTSRHSKKQFTNVLGATAKFISTTITLTILI